MTERLYYEDVYMTEFDAAVLGCTKEGEQWRIIPDRSAFYPEGGGQSGDRGSLTVLSSGEEIEVSDTREDGDDVVLICSAPVADGEKIRGKLNWEYRFDRMQNHSGEHIISGLIHNRFGYSNVGFHMSSDRMTIDLDGEIPDDALAEIEQAANEIVWKNVPIRTDLLSEEEAEQIDYRSKKKLQGEIRIVSIPGADVCACCGTHVSHTGEIGIIRIISHVRFKGGVRMEMMCGRWAYRYMTQLFGQNHQVSVLLSSKMHETARAVRKLLDDQSMLKGQLIGMRYDQIERKAEELRGCGNVLIFVRDYTPVLLQKLTARIMEQTSSAVFSFSGSDEVGYKYAVGQAGGNLKETVQAVNSELSGRGGGKPFFQQGSVQADRKRIELFFNERYKDILIVDM